MSDTPPADHEAAPRLDVEPQGAALGHAVIADHKRRRGAPWTMAVAARPDIEPQGAALGHAVIDQHHQQRRDAERPGLEAHAERDQPPGHVVQALGERPADDRRGGLWDNAAQRIENYRQRWEVHDPDRALGERPTAGGEQLRDFATTTAGIERSRNLLGHSLGAGRER